MEIIKLSRNDAGKIAALIARFRVALRSYTGIASEIDEEAGREEAEEYLNAGWPVYAAREGDRYVGYLVCRIEGPCVWAESLYVEPGYRRRGVASALFEKAEEIAASFGGDTVFNYVHPNNDGVIAFLKSRGYDVLNLIELRKPYDGEEVRGTMRVGGHEYRYGNG